MEPDDLPIEREERIEGEPHGYGWVRVTHTILHPGKALAHFGPNA